jgi:hypothetical protein
MKKNLLLPLGMISVLAAGLLLRPERAAAAPAVTSVSPIMMVDANDTPVGSPVGSSQLVREDSGITLTATTSKLTPLNTYTVWWEITTPDKKPVFTANTSGGIVLPNGTTSFVVHLPVGPLPAVNGTTVLDAAAMFNDPRGVQVAVWIREHGPVIPGQLVDQLTAYEGGCKTNTCKTVQNTIHTP